MRERLLEIIACPQCSGRLRLADEATPDADGHLIETTLACSDCESAYPVRRGVPLLAGPGTEPGAEGTTESFGFEWNRWSDFGWGEEQEAESTTFEKKCLLSADELAGSLILDAGCGNGRYLNQAARRGAEVVGLDLSNAVFPAFENTRAMEGVHVVQGDIFRPPFADGRFDGLYSIGVLMHTGDARRAFDSVASKVKPGGLLSIHVYKKGTRIYEWVDAAIRRRTVAWPRERMLRAAERAARIAAAIPPRILNWVNSVVRIQAHPSVVYDWYATELVTHHTYPEVESWFADAGISVTATGMVERAAWKERLNPLLTVTVKGRVDEHTSRLPAGRAAGGERSATTLP